jgi:hypothetical protein
MDINQSNPVRIAINQIRVYIHDSPGGGTVGGSGQTLVWSLDNFSGGSLNDNSADDHTVVGARLASGSGRDDLIMLIPESAFPQEALDECPYDQGIGTSCNKYFTFFSEAGSAVSGGQNPHDASVVQQGGFEEWGVLLRPIPPKLTLKKIIINDNGGGATVDHFQITTSAGTPSWDCETLGTTTTCTSQTFTLPGADTYTFAEVDFPGYTEGTWSCDPVAATGTAFGAGSVTLADGESTTCTITNDDDPAHITLVKRVVNDNGGTATAATFGIQLNGDLVAFGDGVADGANTLKYSTIAIPVNAGLQSFTELNVAGYTEGSWSCALLAATGTDFDAGSVTLANGESTTCTITNEDDPAQITLVKRVVNDNGGTATAATFGIRLNGDLVAFGDGAADGANTLKYSTIAIPVNAGLQSFTELDVAGYTEGTWSCDPVAATGTAYNAGSVTLANGQSTTCTITNDDDPGYVVLIKRVDNLYGGTATADDFGIVLNGSPVPFGAGSTVGTVTSYSSAPIAVDAGLQSFSEQDVAGYTEGSWSCSPVAAASTSFDDGSVNVANGQTVTCEITNTQDQPPMGTETAYAFGGYGADGLATCFSAGGFSQWGWTNGTISEGTYQWPMYAGASSCDPATSGTYAGFVRVSYTSGDLSVQFFLEPGFTLESQHVYAGSTMFPKRDGVDTVAPGQYYIQDPLTGQIHVIVHAVVGTPQY